ncbi:tetratricopeptide repeat protein [bacterium]|nr:tetratricopeptide repeat protein [bacterium]
MSSNKPTLYPFDSQALTQLALGSSVFIATVLAITDIVPLIPNANSAMSLAQRVAGDWAIAAFIWFLGFSAITQSLRFISRGIWLSDKGIKLSCFDRVVPWSSIKGVAVEPNFFFTRLFLLKNTARRLTFLFHFEVKNKIISELLFPNYIPSFFFSKETFDQLVSAVFERSNALPTASLPQPLPNDYAVLSIALPQATLPEGGTDRENWRRLRLTYLWLNKQKVLVSAIILISLVFFLGRKAVVYYCYNCADKAMTQARFEDARDYYQWAIKLEPTFAAAWNGKGQAEFRLAGQQSGNFSQAIQDWHTAILLKLDYAEPRLNLARVCFYRGNYAEARSLIEHVLKLAPHDKLALLEKAELDLYTGQYRQAQEEARLLSTEDVSDSKNAAYIFKARCLLAQIKLAQGNPAAAQVEIAHYSSDPQSIMRGMDITYLMMTRAQILLALGQLQEAERHIEIAMGRQPYNQEVWIQGALISLARRKFANSESRLARALAINACNSSHQEDPRFANIFKRLAKAQSSN